MVDLALDFSFTHPPVSDLHNVGCTSILIYSRISTPPTGYLLECVDQGIGVNPIFETGATRPFDGYDAGRNDGDGATSDLVRIGVPDGVTLYVNMGDTPNVGGHESAIADYARGFAETFDSQWNLGAYGGAAHHDAAQAGSPRFEKLWGVETWGAPRGNPDDHFAWWSARPGVVLVQMANIPPPIDGTDTNWIVPGASLGAWGGNEGDDVLNDADKEWIQQTIAVAAQQAVNTALNTLIGDDHSQKATLVNWFQDNETNTVNRVVKALKP